MGKKDKGKKKGKGAEKTAMKTDKKLLLKQKKFLAEIGEVRTKLGVKVGRIDCNIIDIPG